MGLTDRAMMAFNGAATRLRRDAIVYGICAFCAVAAIVIAASASILALEPSVGVIYARLIVAGAFVLIALLALLWLRLLRPRPAAATPLFGASAEPSQRSAQFAQIAMIVEAVMLGYSLSRRSDRR